MKKSLRTHATWTTSLTLVCAFGAFGALGALVACKSGPAPKYPPQPDGCEVSVYPEAPGVSTEGIGSVSVTCDTHLSDDECLRGLKDEACRLGANVLWGVDPKPKADGEKMTMTGRAAHTVDKAGAGGGGKKKPHPSLDDDVE